VQRRGGPQEPEGKGLQLRSSQRPARDEPGQWGALDELLDDVRPTVLLEVGVQRWKRAALEAGQRVRLAPEVLLQLRRELHAHPGPLEGHQLAASLHHEHLARGAFIQRADHFIRHRRNDKGRHRQSHVFRFGTKSD